MKGTKNLQIDHVYRAFDKNDCFRYMLRITKITDTYSIGKVVGSGIHKQAVETWEYVDQGTLSQAQNKYPEEFL